MMPWTRSNESFGTWLKYEVIKFRYRHARGHGWVLYLENAGATISLIYVLKDAAIEYGLIKAFPVKWFVYIAIFLLLIEYWIGYIDEKKGILLPENDYASRKMNPFNTELMERVRDIQKRL